MALNVSSYTSLSRHGIYYFRYPWGCSENGVRKSLRLSLQTRCPRIATSLARQLAVYCEHIQLSGLIARMDYKEAHAMVKRFCAERLAKQKAFIDRQGYSSEKIKALESNIEWLEQDITGGNELADDYITPIDEFKAFSELSEGEWRQDKDHILPLLRRGYLEQIQYAKSYAESYVGFGVNAQAKQTDTILTSAEPEYRLSELHAKYIAERKDLQDIASKTIKQRDKSLVLLAEIVGKDIGIDQFTGAIVRDVRDVIIRMPVNKNKNPKTRELSLREAIEVEGIDKIDDVTANKYLADIKGFFNWCVDSRYVEANPFQEVRIKGKNKKQKQQRKHFTKPMLQKMYNAINDPIFGHSDREDYEWIAMIGMYTGARLGEITQLLVSDVRSEDGIWHFVIDEQDNDEVVKSVKNQQSIRQVPIHKRLLELGLLDYVERIRSEYGADARLFPVLSYSEDKRYTRQPSDWFNTKFLPRLDLKTKQYVFHSFRNSMMQYLLDAEVEKSVIQDVVGHDNTEIIFKNYAKEGYSLSIKREAINRFSIE